MIKYRLFCLFLSLGFIVSCLSSCMRQLSEPVLVEQKHEKRSSVFSLTKSETDVKVDSLAGIIYRQTDPDMRMLNQILLIDGRYYLAITVEEAVRLGIPKDVYSKYEEYVKKLNEKKKR